MRKQAREVVYKVLFSQLFNSNDSEIFKKISDEAGLNETDVAYAKKLYNTIESNIDELNKIISELANNYKLERVYPTDKCALFIGLCEMKYFDDIPNIVAIDEALSLCRIYSTAQSLSFVNGIFAEYKKILENLQD